MACSYSPILYYGNGYCIGIKYRLIDYIIHKQVTTFQL